MTSAKSGAKKVPSKEVARHKTAAGTAKKVTTTRKASSPRKSPTAAEAKLTATPASLSHPTPLPFDPATGEWVPTKPVEVMVVVDPAAPRHGVLSKVVWALLILDLAALAWLILNNVVAGGILVFSPDSASADRLRDQLSNTNAQQILISSLTSLLLFGLIPLAWVLGTRQKPWAGTRKYLHLDGNWRYLGKAVLLTIPILMAVTAFVYLYTFATEGAQGLRNANSESNPAVDALLEHMTLPLALVVSLSAGIGEELMFRGLLQRRIGIWGQAGLFGLAHAAGGYLPQIVFAFVLAVGFGFLIKRGWPLWALMVTHFLYNFTLLASAVLGGNL